MQRAYWLVAAILAIAACGGSQKASEPAVAPPPVQELEAETPPPVAPGPSAQEICESLCDRVTECATELNPETPDEAEVAQYRSDCIADVCARQSLARERACLDADGQQCPTFFQCLQEIDTNAGDDANEGEGA